MSYMAKDGDLTLVIFRDENIILPTKANGNFSTMHTWAYNLDVGDETSVDYPDVFLMEKIWDLETPEKTVERAVQGEFRDIKLCQNSETTEWELTYYSYHEKGNKTEILEPDVSMSYLELTVLENMWSLDTFKLASETNLIMAVNFCEGELSTEITDVSWGENQIGYIFASHEEIQERFGEVNEETLKQAQELLQEELETHNHYHKGNIFSYLLYDGCEEVARQDGLVGDIRDVVENIRGNLPELAEKLVKNLDYVDQKEVEQFLYEASEEEMEEDR